jgi:hypothetical protein
VTCYPIAPGDTAAGLARRITGDADNRHRRGFQIVNPSISTPVSKSRYRAIEPGWRVCVSADLLPRGVASLRPEVSSGQLVPPAPDVTRGGTTAGLTALWWALPLFVAVSGTAAAGVGRYLVRRRASLEIMSGFGGRFIFEFERPLFRRAAAPAVRSRVRFAPSRQRLQILLAPAEGRTYPNLSDHRRNVEYDVERVLRLVGDEAFVSEPLYAEGRWVVIPFHIDTNRQQEGAS